MPDPPKLSNMIGFCQDAGTPTTRAVILTGADARDAVIVAPSQRRMQIT